MTRTNPARVLIVAAALAMSASPGVGTVAGIVTVPFGASLQGAIDRARPGDTLVLDAGATYVGNFVLPVKPGNQYITIRTAGEGDGFHPTAENTRGGDPGSPRPGERVLPAHAARLAKLKSPNREPVLRTAASAHHWRVEQVEQLPRRGGRKLHPGWIRSGDSRPHHGGRGLSPQSPGQARGVGDRRGGR